VDVINRELKDKARGIVLALIMPSLRSTSISVVAEYLQLLKSKDTSPSADSQPVTRRSPTAA
jgi:branched-chain amino acid transport system substrate-binding protein